MNKYQQETMLASLRQTYAQGEANIKSAELVIEQNRTQMFDIQTMIDLVRNAPTEDQPEFALKARPEGELPPAGIVDYKEEYAKGQEPPTTAVQEAIERENLKNREEYILDERGF